MNLYAYVHNAPLTHLDEYGLIDYGQWDSSWKPDNTQRFLVAGIHETGNQFTGLGRFAASTPFFIEKGFNYLTGREADLLGLIPRMSLVHVPSE